MTTALRVKYGKTLTHMKTSGPYLHGINWLMREAKANEDILRMICEEAIRYGFLVDGHFLSDGGTEEAWRKKAYRMRHCGIESDCPDEIDCSKLDSF